MQTEAKQTHVLNQWKVKYSLCLRISKIKSLQFAMVVKIFVNNTTHY